MNFDTFKLSRIITYRRPGVSFCIILLVASGVTSLGVKPVPPNSFSKSERDTSRIMKVLDDNFMFRKNPFSRKIQIGRLIATLSL